MNYQEARAFLDEVGKSGSVLGLEGMRELLNRLGNPQDELKFIHISGTNGKGSELAFLSEILTKSGYRTGRYISPTLYSAILLPKKLTTIFSSSFCINFAFR